MKIIKSESIEGVTELDIEAIKLMKSDEEKNKIYKTRLITGLFYDYRYIGDGIMVKISKSQVNRLLKQGIAKLCAEMAGDVRELVRSKDLKFGKVVL